jgi:sec-independent protein translocase protein TatA
MCGAQADAPDAKIQRLYSRSPQDTPRALGSGLSSRVVAAHEVDVKLGSLGLQRILVQDRRFGRRRRGVSDLMGTFTIWHWVIVLVVVLVLFGGRGKLSGLMGDAAKGIRAFKDGLKGEDHTDASHPAGAIPHKDAEKEDVRR